MPAAKHLDRSIEELSLADWTVRGGGQSYPMASLIASHFGAAGFEFVGDEFFKIPKSVDALLGNQSVFWEVGWGGAEVEVDEETGALSILKLVVGGDAGRAIHLDLCQGQLEGAAVMGLGQVLFESRVYDNGELLTRDPLHYRVPSALDVPRSFDSFVLEQGLGPGPGGAKGLAEIGTLVVANAVANALEDAVGVRIRELPLSPEKVLTALADNSGEPLESGPYRVE